MAANALRDNLGHKTVAFMRGSDIINCANPESYYCDLYGRRWAQITKAFRYSLNQSDTNVVVSQWFKDFAQQLGIRVDGIAPAPAFESVIPLGVYPNESPRLKDIACESVPDGTELTTGNKWVLFLGRMSFEKHPDLVLESFIQSEVCRRGVTLIFAGNGPKEEEIRQMAKEQCNGRVVFTECQPSLVPLICKCARVLVHAGVPTDKFIDGRPGSVTNASFVGCPVILPYTQDKSCGGAHESVGSRNREALSYDPHRSRESVVKQIANRLDTILVDEELFAAISAENVQFAACLDPRKVFADVEGILKELCVGQPRSSKNAL